MARFDHRTLMPAERAAAEQEIIELLSKIKRKHDLQDFLLDLLTQSEIVMLSRRLRIAKLLLQGESYIFIRQALGVGFSTIQGVDKWLEKKFASYRKTIAPVIAAERKRERRTLPHEEGPWKTLRRRFPLRFLLLNVLLDDIEWNVPKKKNRL
jgi:uncharacterized protein YerC